MGIMNKPTIKEYWSTRESLSTPFFPKIMSRNRYEEILRCLHFCDNSQPSDGTRNRLWKLGTFFPNLVEKFASRINAAEYLCVDESLVSFKGRLSFKQYNPLKRSRFGIKYFAVVDCKTKFMMKVNIYLGKSAPCEDIPELKEYGLGGSTVIMLLQEYLGKNHKLVIDNYFNSPKLQNFLASEKTYCLGTVRGNRKGMPKMNKKLKKGEVDVVSTDKLVLERWQDRRLVLMLNSFLPHQMVESISPNPNNTRMKPLSVMVYNKKMGGVDHIDQQLAPYETLRKTIKWYKKLAFHLIDLALYNSHVLFKHYNQVHTDPRLKYKDFLLDIIDDMTGTTKKNRRSGKKSMKKETNMHLPEKVMKSNGKPKKSDCHYCRKNGKRKQTYFKCSSCNKRLCITGGSVSCFTEFHLGPGLRQHESQNHDQELSSIQPASTFSQLSVPVSSYSEISRAVLESDEENEPYAEYSMDYSFMYTD